MVEVGFIFIFGCGWLGIILGVELFSRWLAYIREWLIFSGDYTPIICPH